MRDVKPGLTLQGHEVLADQLRRMQAEVQAVRARIRAGLGSATVAYQGTAGVLRALRALQNALVHELAGEHAGAMPMAALTAIYTATGPEAPRFGADPATEDHAHGRTRMTQGIVGRGDGPRLIRMTALTASGHRGWALGLVAVVLLGLGWTENGHGAPGDLDPTFGDQGRVTTTVNEQSLFTASRDRWRPRTDRHTGAPMRRKATAHAPAGNHRSILRRRRSCARLPDTPAAARSPLRSSGRTSG
jgi:hypothetical protein